MLSISIVIPTKNREEDLSNCIQSIAKQTALPREVVIIDDEEISDINKNNIHSLLKGANIEFQYFQKDKPGLAESKNLGTKKARGEIILFLDDDVVLENDYLEKLSETWEQYKNDKNLAGVAGFAINVRKRSFFENIFNRIFFLYGNGWKILPWGFQTWDYNLKRKQRTDWIPGYNSSFRKEIFNKHLFKPLKEGRTALEDIEFCWNLRKEGYYFLITPFAKLIHKESRFGREKAFVSGVKEGFNRCVIFDMHAEKTLLNYIRFIIANFGWIMRQWIAALVEYKNFSYHILYGFGLIKGILDRLVWRK